MAGIIEEALVAYTYVGLWICMSAGVILYNKYILTVFGFPFPVALTMIHMVFLLRARVRPRPRARRRERHQHEPGDVHR